MTDDDTDDGRIAHEPHDPTTPRIGVCYFPEHWPRDRWERDVELMVEAGIEVVRMAEFSWGRIEPTRGEFDFEWLDEAVALLGEAGIDVVLCTPTATPPKWLVDERPEILQEEPDGTTRAFGSRRHYCFNSDAYREETERVVTRMADHYADNPHVVGWQTDNEYGCHQTIRCYCDDCGAAFRDWCRERYGDVETLNETWGTTFWSQQHADFSEVDPPRHTATEHHPSRLLDFGRFASDSAVDYNRLQTGILREANADWFVTHNFMGNFPTLDAYDVTESLEFATWDSYPTGFAQDRRLGESTPERLRAGDPDQVSLNHDLYRTPAGFWVMEQQPGDINWPPYAPQPGEGAMRLWAHQAVAHGANTVSYFRWRRCRQGQEQYHAGLLRHDGTPDRGFEDAREAAAELAELDLAGVDAPVALLFSYDDLWALSEQPHSPEFDYWQLVGRFYRALRGRGVQVDVVQPEADLSGYAAVVAPTLHLADGALADHLESYLHEGGQLLFGPRSGYKLPGNRLQPDLAPGPFTSLVGGHVDQHESPPETLATELSYRGDEYEFDTWGEWLVADDATVVGRHESGTAEGNPALLHHDVGDGAVTYCGVQPGTALADALVSDLLGRAGVGHTERLPETVRLAERDGVTWVLNFGSESVTVDGPADAEWIVGAETVSPFGVGVVEAPASSLGLVDTE
ncbi:beta-galactosidase [Halobaculum marinum]|uniref:beta-galactosidase n=1 Tax=Halobaculum marinum TaxID=3031996 RepID=A0ABD5WR85_9EURY|nr:beta-galactosidase [Halobaculum sp. DT55]